MTTPKTVGEVVGEFSESTVRAVKNAYDDASAVSMAEKNMKLAINALLKSAVEGIEGLFYVYPDGGIHDFGPDEPLISQKEAIALLTKMMEE